MTSRRALIGGALGVLLARFAYGQQSTKVARVGVFGNTPGPQWEALPENAARARLGRGPQPGDRRALDDGRRAACRRPRREPGRAQSRCARGELVHPGGGAARRDHDDPDDLRGACRSGGCRACRQPGAPRRQHHRSVAAPHRREREDVPGAARGGSARHADRRAVESDRAHASARAEGGGGLRAAARRAHGDGGGEKRGGAAGGICRAGA